MLEYLAKWEVAQKYGGPEEGGWWYDAGYPIWKYGVPLVLPKRMKFAICRFFNRREQRRRRKENEYGYTSVLSHRDSFYEYGTSERFRTSPFPDNRPHYE